MRLDGGKGNGGDDVVHRAPTGEVVARFGKPLQDGERGCTADALGDFVADVARLKVWEDQTFKTGNGSENFYDMQYRVIRCLRDILSGDDGKNIVIVSHSGVIRAVQNNIKGLKVDDDWDKLEKGSFVETEGGLV